MPNPDMSKFLYAMIKQLDLKSIDWNQVSSELGITNGHAARMRYSRFKQQMEGNTPVRRARNQTSKRVPKNKPPKSEDEASQEHTPAIPEIVVKPEPQEDHISHPVSPDGLPYGTARPLAQHQRSVPRPPIIQPELMTGPNLSNYIMVAGQWEHTPWTLDMPNVMDDMGYMIGPMVKGEVLLDYLL